MTVRGRWTKATIVSVVAAQGATGELVGSLPQVRAAHAWTAASDTTGREDTDRFVREVVGSSRYSGLFVVTANFDAVSPVRAAITKIGYSSSAPESLIATVRRYSTVVEIVLTAIGLIALTIAALGIANAMLAAVRERRREIGVLKAIGAATTMCGVSSCSRPGCSASSAARSGRRWDMASLASSGSR